MRYKRKYSSEDDFFVSEDETQHTRRNKRSRKDLAERTLEHRRRIGQDHVQDSQSASFSSHLRAKCCKPIHRRVQSGMTHRRGHLLAEIAGLADFNAPPVDRRRERYAEDNIRPRSSRLRTRTNAQAAWVEKPRTRKAAASFRKRPYNHALRNEVEELKLWTHWESEEERRSNEADSEDDFVSQTHAQVYPPKRTGVQNVPWSSMPAEMRNLIYEHCMAGEEEKVLNVLRYPHGIPRRSVRGVSTTTNFAHSYWGLTQTCRQIRKEFTPWLLSKRHIMTPLATLNTYIDTFHRPNPTTGERIGNIEPTCNGGPLPGNGIEILNVLKDKHASPNFHLQLTPTPVDAVQNWLQPEPVSGTYDELMIMREIEQFCMIHSGDGLHEAGIKGIRITSILHESHDEDHHAEDSEDVDERSHDIMIELDIDRHFAARGHRGMKISKIHHFVFQSNLAHKEGVQVNACIAGGRAQWTVRRPGVVYMSWKQKKKEGTKIYRKLTASAECSRTFGIEYLN